MTSRSRDLKKFSQPGRLEIPTPGDKGKNILPKRAAERKGLLIFMYFISKEFS
jgi:hypothetical protein